MKNILFVLILNSTFLIVNSFPQQQGWFWQNPSWGGMGANDVCFMDENTGWIVSFLGTVMKTTDGGQNFFEVDLNTDVTFLGVCFPNHDVGYVFGGGGKIFKTTNGGTDWIEKPNSINQYLSDGYFFDENTGWICGYNGTVVKTTDGGTTWENYVTGTTSILNTIHFFDENNGIVGGWNNILLKTTNGGLDWFSIAPTGNQLFYSVYFASLDTIFAGVYGILRSTDGGITWTSQSTPSQFNAVSINFYNDAKTGIAVGDLGKVLKTTNAGENWLTLFEGNHHQVKKASFIDTTHIFCAGSKGTSGTNILTSTNSGQTWNDYSSIIYFSFLGMPSAATKIFFLNENKGYVTGDNEVWITTDGGTTWVLSPVNANTTLYDINFYDENVGIVVGMDIPSMFRTTDGGLNWQGVSAPYVNLGEIELPEYPVGYAFGDGILKTTDGGLNWTSLNVPALSYIGSFINKDTGWVAGAGFIKKTMDGGETWIDLYNGSGVFYSIYFETADTGWACGSGHYVGRTTDGGLTWIPVHSGITGTNVGLTDLSFINSKQGFVCGKNGFLGYTNDGGITWHKQNARVGFTMSSICFIDSTTGWITGYGGFVKKTTSGGELTPFTLTYERENLNKPISDLQNTFDTIQVNIEAYKVADYVVSDVNVTIDEVIHTNDSDLEFYLIHEGVTDTLIFSVGDDGDNFIGTILDDSSPQLLIEGTAPFTGTFKPHSPLSVFNNLDPNGEWILKVYDNTTGNTGTLQAWKLQLQMSLLTGVEQTNNNIPESFSLDQNFPNPFNPATTIRFNIPQSGKVTLKIYDILGREVKTLLNDYRSSGTYDVTFDANGLASGIYFYQLKAGEFVQSKKMVLIK